MTPEQEAILRDVAEAANHWIKLVEWSDDIERRGVMGFVDVSDKEFSDDDAARVERLKQAVIRYRQVFHS